MGPLMDSHVTSTITAETAVQLYFLNITDLEMAFDVYPEVKLKLWKNCAIKIVSNLLSEHKEFQVSCFGCCDQKFTFQYSRISSVFWWKIQLFWHALAYLENLII